PRRGRACDLPRRPVRRGIGNRDLREHAGFRADHRHPRPGRGQGLRPGRQSGRDVASHPDLLLVGPAAAGRDDPRASSDGRGPFEPDHADDRHFRNDRDSDRTDRRGRSDEPSHAPGPANLEARAFRDRPGLQRRTAYGCPRDVRKADHARHSLHLLAIVRNEQAGDLSGRVARLELGRDPRAARRERHLLDRRPPTAAVLVKRTVDSSCFAAKRCFAEKPGPSSVGGRALLAAAILLVVVALPGQTAEERPPALYGREVASVSYTCDGLVDRERVGPLIEIRPGRPLTEADTGATIRNLFATRAFANVQIEAPAEGDRVSIVVPLFPALRVQPP